MTQLKPTIGDAIKLLNANAEFSTSNDVELLDNIIWHNNTTPIAKEDIIAKYDELVTAWENSE